MAEGRHLCPVPRILGLSHGRQDMGHGTQNTDMDKVTENKNGPDTVTGHGPGRAGNVHGLCHTRGGARHAATAHSLLGRQTLSGTRQINLQSTHRQ